MEYLAVFFLIVPIMVIMMGVIKYLFWLFLIALLFTADDNHLKNSRRVIFLAITILVSVMVIYEKTYNAIGFGYALGGLFAYMVFHWISGFLNKSEKIKKLKQAK